MQKIRYEVDPYNRLTLSPDGAESGLPLFRQVLDGKFKTNENNDLTYHVKAPLSCPGTIPNQIKLKGAWSLTGDHRLRFTLDKIGRQTLGDQLTFSGEILDVNEDSLLFAITTRSKDAAQSTYVLELSGRWRADKNNRLTFHVRKEKGLYDILTFTGAWEIGKNNQIIYRYEKARLLKKKSEIHTVEFKGYWDIRGKARISYVLGAGSDSIFDFGAAAGVFKNDYIKYQVGIGASSDKNFKLQKITLSGIWRLKKDLGLIFETGYEGKRTRAIVFGAEADLTGKDTVTFRLKSNMDNKDIGASLELSHKLLKGDGQLFLRALKSNAESAVYAGAAWRW
jgi:hypothetical protein